MQENRLSRHKLSFVCSCIHPSESQGVGYGSCRDYPFSGKLWVEYGSGQGDYVL